MRKIKLWVKRKERYLFYLYQLICIKISRGWGWFLQYAGGAFPGQVPEQFSAYPGLGSEQLCIGPWLTPQAVRPMCSQSGHSLSLRRRRGEPSDSPWWLISDVSLSNSVIFTWNSLQKVFSYQGDFFFQQETRYSGSCREIFYLPCQ